MNGPTGAGQGVRVPAPAHLHDGNSIPFLHQSKRRYTAAKSGAYDDKVEIELWNGRHNYSLIAVTASVFCPLRRRASMTSPIRRRAPALCGASYPNNWKTWFMSSQVSRTTSAPWALARSANA